MGELLSNNEASVIGKVCQLPYLSHTHFEEEFYILSLEVPRLSDNSDEINIMISEKLYDIEDIEIGDVFKVSGQFRSYNNYSGIGNRLMLVLFAKEIEAVAASTLLDDSKPNSIHIKGYICKEPIYRTTPFGREITDLLVAVNRAYGKSDYLPCIAWGRNAKYSSKLSVGDMVEIWGRMQSREYQKRLENDEVITKKAFEISISRIDNIEE
ncbi:MAG: single-stranded DNA-binding protein [Clostridia bacterium]|nr:single-stranded DNA-binding protein [Clostridia bacterium]